MEKLSSKSEGFYAHIRLTIKPVLGLNSSKIRPILEKNETFWSHAEQQASADLLFHRPRKSTMLENPGDGGIKTVELNWSDPTG